MRERLLQVAKYPFTSLVAVVLPVALTKLVQELRLDNLAHASPAGRFLAHHSIAPTLALPAPWKTSAAWSYRNPIAVTPLDVVVASKKALDTNLLALARVLAK
jgi:hypothetical protein